MTDIAPRPILEVDNLRAGYGGASVLAGLSFSLAEGRSLALLGRNGMGKTTLLRTIMGLTRQGGGRILLAGQDISALAPNKRVELGLAWVPQERNVFRSLTVQENLSAVARPGPWDLARVWRMFPRLEERRANMGRQLSGGEQQMLAIARALVLNPRLLLLDEPTEGLAPIIVEEVLGAIAKVIREDGVSAILVEQHARKILGMTDDAIILERGSIVHAGPSAALAADAPLLERTLGVG